MVERQDKRDKLKHVPLLLPLVALAAGVLAARVAGFETRELLGLVAGLSALTVFAYWRSTRGVAMLCCLAGLWGAGALVEIAHRPGPRPELDAEAREIVILGGCVVEPPVFFENREQFVLELEPGARARVNWYLAEGERAPALRYGQRVELEARVRRMQNFRNPGSFDYARYQARQNVYWTASVPRGTAIRVLEGECGSRFWSVIFAVRGAALERLERLYRGDSYRTAMMQAILIGDSSKLEKVWTEDFRRTGTYHALVISGLHVTVLAAFFLFLLRICLVPEGLALTATTLAAWLYALVSGGQAPVFRAAAGFTLYVVVRYFYRRGQLLNLLAMVAIGFIMADPEQMFEASFQLTFLSVAAIGALAVPLLERTSAPLAWGLRGLADVDRDPHLAPRVAHFRLELRLLAETVTLWTRIPQRWVLAALAAGLRIFFYAYDLVIVSAMVQIGLVLPMAIYFHRLSLTGLSANVLIVPLMSLVVPVGFVAICTGWHAAAVLAGWLLTASQRVAEWHVRWEPGWRIPDPPLWLAIAFTAAVIAAALFNRRDAETQRKTGLALRLCVFAVSAMLLALLALVVWHPFPPKVERGTLELTAIDVGQGESLLLAFPEGALMILDGGGIPAFGRRTKPRLDIGEDVVSPYLWSRSIRRLDVVALSHAHEDHMDGLAALIDNFHPKELWTGAIPEDAPGWAALRQRAWRQGVKMIPMRAGRRFPYGGAQVEVLAPLPDYEPAPKPQNNDSLVLRVSYGGHSFLLAGDIERQVESELVARGLVSKTEVLKVAHHGGRTSSGGPFLDLARPALAVISAGFENSYSVPHREVIERLRERRVAVLRTDLGGLVTVRTDGRRLRLK